MQDKYGHTRTQQGGFDSGEAGADHDTQMKFGVNQYDTLSEAQLKIYEGEQAEKAANDAQTNFTQLPVSGQGGTGFDSKDLMMFASIAAALFLVICLSAVDYNKIAPSLGMLGLTRYVIATGFVATAFAMRKVANKAAWIKLACFAMGWYFLRIILLPMALFIDVCVAAWLVLMFYRVVMTLKKKRV